VTGPSFSGFDIESLCTPIRQDVRVRIKITNSHLISPLGLF
jgi:hypothetical protein